MKIPNKRELQQTVHNLSSDTENEISRGRYKSEQQKSALENIELL